MARRDQRLYRDGEDKKIAGVCSGLAYYFDIDTTLVRLAFVVLVLLGGGGFLAYLVLWLIMDEAPPGYWDRSADDIDLRAGASDAPSQPAAPQPHLGDAPRRDAPP